jgi:hypothetical protein
MSQTELDQLLAKQTDTPTKSVSPPLSTKVNHVKTETTDSDVNSTNETATTPTTNYNPYSYPPPAFGMPFGGIPPHLMPHIAQMMQNGSLTMVFEPNMFNCC